MNGSIIPGTSIAVDFWPADKHPGIRFFFLTHLHGDHVVGLTSKWRRPIYCSPLTARLLEQRYDVDRSLLRSLEEDQTHMVGYCQSSCVQSHGEGNASGVNGQSSLYFNKGQSTREVDGQIKLNKNELQKCESMAVTVINANHCPGAVMFVFEGSFGKIVHTGDFRFQPEMVKEGSLLSKHTGTIDRLYLDNTYCDPKCVFPTRAEALEEIVQICKTHSNHDIVLGVRNLGKEDLLAAIALALGEWINVSPNTLSIASSLNFPKVFSTGKPDVRVRAVPFHQVSGDFVKRLNKEKPTIVILPTALYQGIGGKPYANQPEVFVVPYSDHSSFPELVQFVSKLKPARVVPIVRGKVRGPFGVDVSSRQNMSCFQQYLSKSQNKCFADTQFSDLKSQKGSLQTTGEDDCLFAGTNGFENLFPDLQKPLKRRQPQKNKPRKALCPKGVIYLSDDEAEREKQTVSPRKFGKLSDDRCLAEQESVIVSTTVQAEQADLSEKQKVENQGSGVSLSVEEDMVNAIHIDNIAISASDNSLRPKGGILIHTQEKNKVSEPTEEESRLADKTGVVNTCYTTTGQDCSLSLFRASRKLSGAQRRARLINTYNAVFGEPTEDKAGKVNLSEYFC
ncbi:5' exonuclease Apollo-like [Littorina saxatilis]|uniref:5' exonuclease Apollo n=1 Tax=Littorina saxatilis TaxID=31220 RepID=A0AAN9BD06_9CAEN